MIGDKLKTVIKYSSTFAFLLIILLQIFDPTTLEVSELVWKRDIIQLNCQPGYVACNGTNKKCIPNNDLCDGDVDCSDGQDETDCATCRGRKDEVYCKDWDNRTECKVYQVCNVAIDCQNGADEINCDFCKGGHFLCHKTRTCVRYEVLCDEKNDCIDGEDELGCELDCKSKYLISCNGTLLVNRSYECIESYLVCNGIKDCSNGQDEENCENCRGQESEVLCPNSTECMYDPYENNFCDGHKDCKTNGADEVGCGNCRGDPNFKNCHDSNYPTMCYPVSVECDGRRYGYNDCYNGYDESRAVCKCNTTGGSVLCSDGLCVPPNLVCNGWADCKTDGEDEKNCPNKGSAASEERSPPFSESAFSTCSAVLIVIHTIIVPLVILVIALLKQRKRERKQPEDLKVSKQPEDLYAQSTAQNN